MKKRLPELTVAAVLMAVVSMISRNYWQHESPAIKASTASVVPGNSTADFALNKPTIGDQLLLQSRTQLERRPSVTARLRHQVSLDGRRLTGVGNYWQQGGGDDLRVRWEFQVYGQDVGLLQVSNGRFLWTDQRLPTGRMIARLDLRKIRNEMSRAPSEFDELESGAATWSLVESESLLHNGGLPALLAMMSRAFKFLPPQSMRWTPEPPLAGVAGASPVYAVVGHWKPDSLGGAMLASSGRDSLPERLPTEVLVLLGQADLVPYRIEFRRQSLTPSTADQASPYQLSDNPLVVLELESIAFDTPIAAGQFDYSPGDAKWDDCTAEALDKLRQLRDAKLAARPRKSQR